MPRKKKVDTDEVMETKVEKKPRKKKADIVERVDAEVVEKEEIPDKETNIASPKDNVIDGECVTSHFPEPEKKEDEKEEILTPAEYFEKVKAKIQTETSDNIKLLYDTAIKQLKKFQVTGQKAAAKELYAKCLHFEKEFRVIEKGFNKYVRRSDIEDFIDNVADECVVVIEMRNYERDIPDDIIEKVSETMDIFDEFYIIFSDYTGEKRAKVAKEKRDKDPILFGNIFIDGKVSPKMYFIGDWVDEFCDLTLDKMIESISKKRKKDKEEIIYDINDKSLLEEIQESFKSKVNTNSVGW